MAEIYKYFAKGWTGLDFSDQSLVDMFNSESFGTSIDRNKNGFYVGKQWLNVTIAMWKEDQRKGHLVLSELYEDKNLPHWWLDSIFR